MAENNVQEQFYGAELAELSKNIKDLHSQVACIKGVCAERYKIDFYSEINILKRDVDDIRNDIEKIEKEGKDQDNVLSDLNNQIIELSGQVNSIKLRIDELLSSQAKQTESKMDLWKQIIIIVLGSLIVSLTLWMSNSIITSFKEKVYQDIKQKQIINQGLYPRKNQKQMYIYDENIINSTGKTDNSEGSTK